MHESTPEPLTTATLNSESKAKFQHTSIEINLAGTNQILSYIPMELLLSVVDT